ncbi:MAG: hypothetical protein AAF368_10740, partial [Planctomycetota bacterium]
MKNAHRRGTRDPRAKLFVSTRFIDNHENHDFARQRFRIGLQVAEGADRRGVAAPLVRSFFSDKLGAIFEMDLERAGINLDSFEIWRLESAATNSAWQLKTKAGAGLFVLHLQFELGQKAVDSIECFLRLVDNQQASNQLHRAVAIGISPVSWS